MLTWALMVVSMLVVGGVVLALWGLNPIDVGFWRFIIGYTLAFGVWPWIYAYFYFNKSGG